MLFVTQNAKKAIKIKDIKTYVKKRKTSLKSHKLSMTIIYCTIQKTEIYRKISSFSLKNKLFFSDNNCELTNTVFIKLVTDWQDVDNGKSNGRAGRRRRPSRAGIPPCWRNSRQWSSVVLLLTIAWINLVCKRETLSFLCSYHLQVAMNNLRRVITYHVQHVIKQRYVLLSTGRNRAVKTLSH